MIQAGEEEEKKFKIKKRKESNKPQDEDVEKKMDVRIMRVNIVY